MGVQSPQAEALSGVSARGQGVWAGGQAELAQGRLAEERAPVLWGGRGGAVPEPRGREGIPDILSSSTRLRPRFWRQM